MSEETENETPEEKEEVAEAAAPQETPAVEAAVEKAPAMESAPGEEPEGDDISPDDTIAAAVGGEEKSEKLLRAEAILQQQAGNSGAPQGGGGGGGGRRDDSRSDDGPELFEKVVFINRCAKVVKGGRRFSFSALVVTGDQNGKVGFGFGKAKEVAEGIRKASDIAKKSMVSVKITENTIPHEVLGEYDGGRVLLRPASPGTGIIAGGGVRAVVEAAGIKDILAKSMGSNNHANVVKATLAGLQSLRTKEEVYKLRGKKTAEKASL